MSSFRYDLIQTVLDSYLYVRIRPAIKYVYFLIFGLIFGLLCSTGAIADTVRVAQCERDELTRIVELTEQLPTGLPCQVLYHKPEEDQSTSRLWYAKSEVNYCRTQFDAFLIKLETKHGWDCRYDELSQSGHQQEDKVGQLADKVPLDKMSSTAVDEAQAMNKTASANDTPTEEMIVAEQKPVLAAAVSGRKADNSISTAQSRVVENRKASNSQPGDEYFFDIEFVKTYIPSGIYFYDSVGSKAQERKDCPKDGYFLWNTQDRSRPVFEMGLVSEFPGASEVPVVQRDVNGAISLSTQSMTLQPIGQTITTVGAAENNGIELQIRGTSSDSTQTTICRFLRG